MYKIKEKVKAFIKEHDMLRGVKTLITGVSGGADSICLLSILRELSPKYGFDIKVVHVNHLIRQEAGYDQAFVVNMCREWNIPCKSYRVDVMAYAREKGLSGEEAGREIRYSCFKEEANGLENVRIATAHNMGDSAETVLLNLFRGSGIRGLTGIPPVRENLFIRPILCLSRQEIEEYLKARNIDWCNDATNGENKYTRNRIRNNVLPYVEKEICHGASAHIYESSLILKKAAAFLEKEADRAYERCVRENEGILQIDADLFVKEDPFIREELLLKALSGVAGKRKDLESVHIRLLESLCLEKGNKSLDLPYGIRVIREYDLVSLIGNNKEFNPKIQDITYETRSFKYKEDMIIPKKGYTKWFDYDKITAYAHSGEMPVFRTRQPGDYLMLNEDGGKKPLNRYMIDQKIPPSIRDTTRVLALEDHVLWVPGYRTSAYFNIGKDTKTVWEVSLCQKP